MRPFKLLFTCSALALTTLVGCTRYFQVSEPHGTGKTYYTTQVQTLGSGSVRFKDMRSGSQITMTSSDVKEIKPADLPDDLRPGK